MIILALDTTAVTASVALLDGECVIASSSVHNKLTHSEKILPMIDEMLKNSGYSVDDIELISVSKGPGSFTGVRIGIATAKGLAYAKKLPVVGVSALEALAENFRMLSVDSFDRVIIAPSMDARRNELYNALFAYDGNELTRLTEDRPISCEELEEEVRDLGSKLLINGDGAEKLHEYLCSRDRGVASVLAPQLILRQNAVSVGKLGYRLYLKGEYEDVNKIAPLYLRTSQAERVNNKE